MILLVFLSKNCWIFCFLLLNIIIFKKRILALSLHFKYSVSFVNEQNCWVLAIWCLEWQRTDPLLMPETRSCVLDRPFFGNEIQRKPLLDLYTV